ncbi:sigma-54-dependent transcriptional regulator [Nannocystaceae bacterium ST9]
MATTKRMPGIILVVEHDGSVRTNLRERFERDGFTIRDAATGAAAIAIVADVDLVLLDRDLPDIDGIEVLRHVASLPAPPRVVMLTRRSDAPGIVESMRLGAWDYLTKPCELESLVALAIKALAPQRTTSNPRASHDALDRIRGTSAAISAVKSLIVRVARSPSSTVLITGESGTGKDLAAKAIHALSTRAPGPFVNVTCSALPSNLLESELFGHERGAFTDAKVRKLGLVELADGGTLFLDELGELDIGLQSKLLRFLEDKTFRRVGGDVDLHADVRVIAATNVDLAKAASERRFREDLYYRLAVLTIELPPLRERRGDIDELVEHFVVRFAHEFGDARPRSVTETAKRSLRERAWPGNVRELKNAVERCVLLAQGDSLDLADFSPVSGPPPTPNSVFPLPSSGVDLRELERSLVAQALKRTHGNITHAGRLLGLNRDQVRYRLEKFNLRAEFAALVE